MDPIIKSASSTVCCTGKNSENAKNPGHPAIYLSLRNKDVIECGYCGQKFIWTDETTDA